ncbi:MAG: T9SS type A sorting domain-containing protein [Saprospiraceae bacterium]|nr:T9SS type A sorting domain-containing protein [Saprospiraceae bacterium]
MKSALLVFALLLPALPSFSQTEFAPVGATWSYAYQTYWTNFNGFFVLNYEKDTVLNNYACKKLHASILDSSLVQVQQQDYFIRQSGDSIFTEFAGLDFSIFLFKNKYQVNETVEFGFLWNDPLTVSAVENLTFGGQSTQKFTLDSDGFLFDQTAIYERFGPVLGFFQSWWGVAVDGESYRLLCYKDDDFPLAEVGNGPCFGLTPTVENAPSTGNLTVFPNPTSDEITFDFHEKNVGSISVSILGLTGQLMLKRTLQASCRLDVSSLPNGIYFGNAVADGQLLLFKFIKQ